MPLPLVLDQGVRPGDAAAVWAGEPIDTDFGVDVPRGWPARKLHRAGPGREWVRTVGGDGYQLLAP